MSWWRVWIPNTALDPDVNVYTKEAFETLAASGFTANTKAKAIDVNSALRQANLIAVALMNALDITGDLTYQVEDISTAIADKLKLYQHHVFVHGTNGADLSTHADFSFSVVSTSSTSINSINAILTNIAVKQSGQTIVTTPASGVVYFNNTVFHVLGIFANTANELNMLVYDSSGVVSTKVFNTTVLSSNSVTDSVSTIQIGG